MFRFVLALLAVTFPLTAFGQINPTSWTAKEVSGGLQVDAKIDEGWHIYSIKKVEDGPFPTGFKFAKPDFKIAGEVTESGVTEKYDKGFDKNVGIAVGTASFQVPVAASGEAKKGEITVTFQACNERGCLMPQDVVVPFEWTAGKTAVASAGTVTSSGPAVQGEVEQARSQGLWAFFRLSLVTGFFSLLTPCVFPMIPITVSIFAKRGRATGVSHAVAFCVGIISTFTLLGLGFSVVAGAAGLQNFANDPFLNIGLGTLFIVLAMGLFGVYEFQLPGGLANKINPEGKAGLLGPISMGLVFSLTSFTCTMPFVGALLVSAARGDLLFPIVGMLGFSTAFALPFFLLALFPQYASKLPRSGGWLAVVKGFMGFIELAAAVKFFSTVDLAWQLGWLTQPVFLALWTVIMTVAAAFLFGWLRIPTVEDNRRPGPLRIGFGLATVALVVSLLGAMNGGSLGRLAGFLPPDPYPLREGSRAAVSQKADDGWIADYDLAIAQAREQNKPLFIDFTGMFCTNCRDMERNVFPDPAVATEFKGFVLARLYTDRRENPSDQRYQKMKIDLTGSVANPVYAILKPDGSLAAFTEYKPDPAAFAKFLANGKAQAVASR